MKEVTRMQSTTLTPAKSWFHRASSTGNTAVDALEREAMQKKLAAELDYRVLVDDFASEVELETEDIAAKLAAAGRTTSDLRRDSAQLLKIRTLRQNLIDGETRLAEELPVVQGKITFETESFRQLELSHSKVMTDLEGQMNSMQALRTKVEAMRKELRLLAPPEKQESYLGTRNHERQIQKNISNANRELFVLQQTIPKEVIGESQGSFTGALGTREEQARAAHQSELQAARKRHLDEIDLKKKSLEDLKLALIQVQESAARQREELVMGV